jgi:UDP-glucose 4-epimerase
MSTKSVLITGAAGFIGSHLAEQCLRRGWRVTAIDAFTNYYSEAVKRSNTADASRHPNYTFIEGDLRELDLERYLQEVEIVFHLAAQAGVRASWDEFELYTRLNLDATQRLLYAARGRPLERFVLASSSSIYGDAESLPTREDATPRPVSPYGVTKIATEYLAQVFWRSYNVPTVSLRYFTVYGPRQRPDMAFHRLIASALSNQPFTVFGDGNQTRDFTFVADAVAGTIAAGERGMPGAAYNLGGGARRSMNSVFDTLEGLIGRTVEREYIDWQLGDARDTGADTDLARRDLGFEPSFDFAAGLGMQLSWQESLVAGAGAHPGRRPGASRETS